MSEFKEDSAISRSSFLYPWWATRKIAQSDAVIESLTGSVTEKTFKRLQKLADKYGFDRITVTNQNGIVVATNNGVGIGVNLSDRNYIQNSLAGEATQTAVMSRIEGGYFFLTAEPVYITQNNIIIGTVSTDILIDKN